MAIPHIQPVEAQGTAGTAGLRVFLSYSHDDGRLGEVFAKHFKVLAASLKPAAALFHDRTSLSAGTEYARVISEAIRKSDVFVLLVSENSLDAESFCMTDEVPAAAAAGIRIIPVILSNCAWKNRPIPGHPHGLTFGALTVRPLDENQHVKPIANWQFPGDAWTGVVTELENVYREIRPRAAVAPAAAGTRPRSRRVGDDLLPYLCNQSPVVNQFDDGLLSRGARALVVLVRGTPQDHPERFWDRLRLKHLCPEIGADDLVQAPINFPVPEHLRVPEPTLQRRIFRDLSLKFAEDGRRIETVEDLAEMVRRLSPALVVFTQAQSGKGARLEYGLAALQNLMDSIRGDNPARMRSGLTALLDLLAAIRSDKPAKLKSGVLALLNLIEAIDDEAIRRKLVVAIDFQDAPAAPRSMIRRWGLKSFQRSLVVELSPLARVDRGDFVNWLVKEDIPAQLGIDRPDEDDIFRHSRSLRMGEFRARIDQTRSTRG